MIEERSEKRAYREGYEAYRAYSPGAPEPENPYQGWEADAWEDGYFDAADGRDMDDSPYRP